MKMVKVIAVCKSKKKGTPKKDVKLAEFKVNNGMIGDAHAGPGIRQVSLLAIESHERFKKNPRLSKVCLKKGSFGENLTTQGIELHKLEIGTRLKIGSTILEVSQIGKECHAPCPIGKEMGTCIMPQEGIFATVKKSGKIKNGDEIIIL